MWTPRQCFTFAGSFAGESVKNENGLPSCPIFPFPLRRCVPPDWPFRGYQQKLYEIREHISGGRVRAMILHPATLLLCFTFRHSTYLHARGRKNAKCSVLSDKSWCPNYRGRTAKTGLILGVVIFTILVLCTMRTCYLSQIFASVINLLHFPSYLWQLTRHCSLGWPIGHS